MSGITTHVLDLANGRPAQGVAVRLESVAANGTARTLSERRTDDDGRVRDLVPDGAALSPGRFRLTFATGDYHAAAGREAFHPEIAIVFEVRDVRQHHHVPLLLSPFGYSTYRGS